MNTGVQTEVEYFLPTDFVQTSTGNIISKNRCIIAKVHLNWEYIILYNIIYNSKYAASTCGVTSREGGDKTRHRYIILTYVTF